MGGRLGKRSRARKVPDMSAPVLPNPDRWAAMKAELHTWRRAHPEATWVEIEAELDRRLHALRASLLGEVVTDAPAATACPHCGGPLVHRGSQTRALVTRGDQTIPLTRAYQTCPACGAGLSPLDERLGLRAATPYPPSVFDDAVLLGAIPPIKQPSGQRRRRPATVHVDKASDMPRCPQALTRRHIKTSRFALRARVSTPVSASADIGGWWSAR